MPGMMSYFVLWGSVPKLGFAAEQAPTRSHLTHSARDTEMKKKYWFGALTLKVKAVMSYTCKNAIATLNLETKLITVVLQYFV